MVIFERDYRFPQTFHPRVALAACLLLAALLAQIQHRVAAAPANTLHYPDLQAIMPPAGFVIVNPTTTTRELRYTHREANLGDGPLVVRMQYDPATDTSRPFQQIYTHNASGTWSLAAEIPVVGTFQYHPLHGHYHFPLAEFGLYTVAGDGSVGSVVVKSPKVGFCLGDSSLVDGTLTHAGTFHNGSNCGDPTANESISVGWADDYAADGGA